jgi:hypothetical protein
MILNVNINVPENLVARPNVTGPGGAALVPPDDSQQNLIPLQGPPISMLLFALTRASTDVAQAKYMTDAQRALINKNVRLYDTYKGAGAGIQFKGNAIALFDSFMTQHPEYLATLKAAQDMFTAYKQFITTSGIWDDSCDLKLSQLANMAQIDWTSF